MKKIFLNMLLIFSIFCINNIASGIETQKIDLNFKSFGAFPVLHEGRVKPLSSLAKNCFYDISKKASISIDESTEWLIELFFDKEKSYNRKIFCIKNKDLLMNLNLDHKNDFMYSLNEVLIALEKRFDVIKLLQEMPQQTLTASQNLLLDIYFKALLVLTLGKITDFVTPTTREIYLNDTIKEKSQYDILKFLKYRSRITDYELNVLDSIKKQLYSKKDTYVCLIPLNDNSWVTLDAGFLNNFDQSVVFLDLFNDLSLAYKKNDVKNWNISSEKIKLMSLKMLSTQTQATIKLEHFYNTVSPLNISMIFYLLSFVFSVLIFLNVFRSALFNKLMLIIFTCGFFVHALAIIIRILITHRPPITSLYESIIFVNLIFVFIVFILSLRLRSHFVICVSIGSFSAFVLQYIGYKLGLDGDNFKNLMSVLNTDFWLITHVITISLGYALCLIVGFLGHVYVYFYTKNYQKTDLLVKLNNLLLTVCMLALFFSLTGTVLGGVWADQSWGRFWGWDPKENGALLIVLWLVFMLHFRMISYFSSLFFAIGMILNNVIVFTTWFGVNLLNIGLHTYGFIQNMGQNLLLFCCFEFLYILVFVLILFFKKHNFEQKI